MKTSFSKLQREFNNDYIKACINILYTSSFMMKMKTDALRPFNLSLQQFNILNILNNEYPKPSTVRLLADRMLDQTSNVSRLVEKLRLKDFVERKSAEDDRRKVEISITKQGLSAFEEAATALENITEFQLSNLSQEEVIQLNKLLDKTRSISS